ncbi:MAG: endonuclease III domain-containing protein, partial [Novosphingobium sp.]
MTRDEIFEFFRRLAELNPSPETELLFGNAFQLVVAVALSAQATDVGVNKATRALFRAVQTPQQMLELGEDGLKEHIKTIGLFNTKAKNVIALSQLLVDEFGGEVPSTREELVRLPGVGRKTANVVLNCWFGQETFAVDT